MEKISAILQKSRLHRLTPKWVERAIATSFYPERARVNFERFLELVEETDPSLLSNLNKRNIPWVSVLFSGSQALTDMAMRSPEWLFWSLQPGILGSIRFKRDMRRERKRVLKKFPKSPNEALCRFRNFELMRIGWRDLLKWADTVETLEDLSRLADITIEGAVSMAGAEMSRRFGRPLHSGGRQARFIVLGMGKLGGRELNFSSDIDLIYLFDNDDGETEGGIGKSGMQRPKISIPEYFNRMAQLITSLLSDISPVGKLYRVDLGLRPEGNRGPIVCSLASAELYYESWGQSWERQAMLKARVCAGDASLTDEFRKMMKPFVYRKNLDFSALREIQQMKEKIDKALKAGKDKFKNNVKLGKGGIREIEFIIQAYQLIYGGKMPWLAETNSLKALHRIFERGLIGYEQYAILADTLLFLRDLENRMQIAYGRQVQILPQGDDLKALALKMSLPDSELLMREYEKVTDSVNEIFEEFFREESQELEEKRGEYYLDLDNEEEAVSELGKMQFDNPQKALEGLLHIRDGEPFNHPSTKSRRMFMNLLPELLKIVSSLPRKDRVVQNLDKFFSAQSGREGIYEILIEFQPSRDVLLNVFAYAQSLADMMVNQPDVMQILASGITSTRSHPLSEIPKQVDTYDKKLDWMRKERNSESLRIGISYLMTHNNPFAMMRHLTDLAEEFIQGCLAAIENEIESKEVSFRPASLEEDDSPCFAVIGMGKLGRSELNYGSDLDLVFIFSDGKTSQKQPDNQTYYSNLSRKLLNAIGGLSQYGVAYRVDTRLRPEGEKGPIVISADEALKYYARRGALWERMALCGARPVAGDIKFAEDFLRKLDRFVYGPGFSDEDEAGMAGMKRKMEREKIKNSKKIALKYGQGGIVDIEFLAQKLKLSHGIAMPHIKKQSTLQILESAKKEGWEVDDPDMLMETYKLLRTVETHIRMESGLGVETLPGKSDRLDTLEQSLRAFITFKQSLADTVLDAMEQAKQSIYGST